MPPQCVANAFNTSHTCRVCHYPLPAGARPNVSAFGALADFRRRRLRPFGARLVAQAALKSQALDAAELALAPFSSRASKPSNAAAFLAFLHFSAPNLLKIVDFACFAPTHSDLLLNAFCYHQLPGY